MQDSAPKPSPAGMIELLTPTQGADFNSYMHIIYLTTRKRWLETFRRR